MKIVKPGHDPRNPAVTTPRASMPVDPAMPSQALINSMMLTASEAGDAAARDVEPQGLGQGGEQGEELETTTVIITTTEDNVAIMESTTHGQS